MGNRIVQIGGSNSLFSAKEDLNNGSPSTGIPVIMKVTDEDLVNLIGSGITVTFAPGVVVPISSDDLAAMNILNMTEFDTILITYTDATKAVISKVEWKLLGVVVRTLTPTFAALTDTWTKS